MSGAFVEVKGAEVGAGLERLVRGQNSGKMDSGKGTHVSEASYTASIFAFKGWSLKVCLCRWTHRLVSCLLFIRSLGQKGRWCMTHGGRQQCNSYKLIT